MQGTIPPKKIHLYTSDLPYLLDCNLRFVTVVFCPHIMGRTRQFSLHIRYSQLFYYTFSVNNLIKYHNIRTKYLYRYNLIARMIDYPAASDMMRLLTALIKVISGDIDLPRYEINFQDT